MVSKVWRILKLIEGSEMGVKVHGAGVRAQLRRVAAHVGVNFLLLASFTIIAPLRWEKFERLLTIDEDYRGVSKQVLGLCSPNTTVSHGRRVLGGLIFLVVLVLNLVLVIRGNVLCYRARGIPPDSPAALLLTEPPHGTMVRLRAQKIREENEKLVKKITTVRPTYPIREYKQAHAVHTAKSRSPSGTRGSVAYAVRTTAKRPKERRAALTISMVLRQSQNTRTFLLA